MKLESEFHLSAHSQRAALRRTVGLCPRSMRMKAETVNNPYTNIHLACSNSDHVFLEPGS